MSFALILTLATPAVALPKDVEAKVIDKNYAKEVLWSTSFESADNFRTSTLDDKGFSNVVNGATTSQLKGELNDKIDLSSLSGSVALNDNEIMSNLFDGDTGTKYITSVEAPEVIVKLTGGVKKVVKTYTIASANDSKARDPKRWTLEGRNSDSDSWTLIDSRSNQKFNRRYYKRNYDISDNTTAYSQYRLHITANNGSNENGKSLTQFSEFTLATRTLDERITVQNGMKSEITTGPSEAWNSRTNKGWSGSSSLVCKGSHYGSQRAYSYNVIYDNLNITVKDNTNLRYVIFPSMSNGNDYDFEYTQMHMAVDLKFKDGTYLSDLNAVDQNGNYVNAQAQGESKTLMTNQWTEIYSKIGDVAKGKVIEKVLVVYDMASHENPDTANFQTYFDDIEIYNQDNPVYSHLSDYVNILRGTNDESSFSRGLTVPAVTMPNGFNFWTPGTNSGSNKTYTYQNTDTFRFMQISHEPSVWVGDRGTWQFMINTSKNSGTTDDFGLGTLTTKYSHDNEVAKAHYYKIQFEDGSGDAANSQMELTPTSHGAVVRFTYGNNASNKSVIFDCSRAGGSVTYSGNTFTAYSDHKDNGSKRMYIYGEFSETPWGTKVSDRKSIASFNSNRVTMKIATSYISHDQAKKNLQLEIGSDSFDTVYNKAQSAWDKQLGIITDVKGANYEQLVTLYSCIYRMYCYPNLMSENTGTNNNPVWKYKSPYRDDNADPVEGTIYINNGFWDTYRTAWAAYGLFTPSKETEMLNGLVQHYKDQGWVPRWIAPGGTNSMVGTSSDAIFADALAKGIVFDYENAYKSAIRNAATVSSNLTNGGRKDLNTSIFRGYTAGGGGEQFSWSMEGYINDYGIAQMAKNLAEKTTNATSKANYLSEYQYYLNRAKNYTLMFDDSGNDISTKWLKGRESNGSFTRGNYTGGDFDPFFWGSDYTETNAYNMSVSVPQDGIGIANLYGGRDQLAEKLDTIFTTDGIFNGYDAVNGVGGIHEQKEAREVKLGQYGHSNQPSHHIPYMYLYSSKPWETQKYVRDILSRCYIGSTFGQGYIGDEDNGEMSAWYVLSSLGFYPLTMGSDEFAIGSPQFEEVTVNLENGKKLVIKANNNSRENVYVDSMYVNGKEYNEFFIKYNVLKNGGTIEFNMSDTPNKARVSGTEDLETITTGDNKPEVYKDFTSDADLSGTNGAATIANLYDNNSSTETTLENTTTLMFTFSSKKAVRMLTLTSAALYAHTPDSAKLYADNGDNNWQLLGEFNDGNTLYYSSIGLYTRPFAISSDKVGEYTRYKLVLTGSEMSLAEVELLGYEGSSIYKSDLKSALDIAKNVNKQNQRTEVLEKYESTISYAKSVYNDSAASDDNVKKAYQEIKAIVDLNLGEIKVKDASHVEAEAFDDKASAIVDDGSNIGGVKRNTWVKYDSVYFNGQANNITLKYAAQSSDAGGYAEIYLNDRAGEPVATVELPITGSGWSNYKTAKTKLNSKVSGLNDVYVVFKNDNSHEYVANVDWIGFDTSAIDVTISDKVKVEGFQISYTLGGLRTVSSVEPEINGQEVVEFGNIYAFVRDDVTTADMVVDSTNSYVAKYAATNQGVIEEKYSESDTAINYIRTMTNNGTTSDALQQKYMIRGYAKLKDGSYVYSEVASYSIFNVAKVLYDNAMMSTITGHNYLYDSILKVVDSSYKSVDYNWGNVIVKP